MLRRRDEGDRGDRRRAAQHDAGRVPRPDRPRHRALEGSRGRRQHQARVSPHGQQQRGPPLDGPLFPRRPERDRLRLSVLQLRHRPRAADRGHGRLQARRPAGARDHPLPAREHRGAHGGGLRHRHRPRPGRDGPCRCRHRQLGDGAAQSLPRPHPRAADGRQGALHDARRASGHARHLRAFRAGAVRPGERRAALHQVGIQSAVRRDRQGGAAPRPHGDAERPRGRSI